MGGPNSQQSLRSAIWQTALLGVFTVCVMLVSPIAAGIAAGGLLQPWLNRAYYKTPEQLTTGGIVIRHSKVVFLSASLGTAVTLFFVYAAVLFYPRTGAVTFVLVIAVIFGGVAYQQWKQVVTRIIVDEQGLTWICGRKQIAIDWSAATVDAVESTAGVTVKGGQDERIVIRKDMVGAAYIEPFVLKFVPESRTRLARSVAGERQLFL